MPHECLDASGGHAGLADIRTEVMKAAKEGKANALVQFVTSHVGVADARMLGKALHFAAQGNHAECCEILLNSGADVDERNSSGNTCMHTTAMAGALETMRLLMDFQASLNIRNSDGKCAIALANNPETRKLISAEVNRRAEAKERRRRFAAEVEARNSLSEKSCRSPLAPRNGRQTAAASSKIPVAKETLATSQEAQPVNPSPSELDAAERANHSKQTELLMCRVCLRDFCSEARTEPICLPCGHTFCSTCIDCLRGTDKLGSTAHSFRCPLDRQVFSRNLDLKVNTLLKEIIPLIRASVGVNSYAPKEPETHQGANLEASTSPKPPALDLPSRHCVPTRDAAVSPMVPSHPIVPDGSRSPLVALSAMLRQGKASPGAGLMNAALQTLSSHLSPASRAVASSIHTVGSIEVAVQKIQPPPDTDGGEIGSMRLVEQVVNELVDATCQGS